MNETKAKNFVSKDQEKLFLKTLNRKGLFLEDKVQKILTEANIGLEGLQRNLPFPHKDGMGDIDLLVDTVKFRLVVECKRTDFTWVFPKNTGRGNRFYLIRHYIEDGKDVCDIKGLSTPEIKSVYGSIVLKRKEDRQFEVVKNGKAVVGIKTHQKQDIYPYIRQVLEETNNCLELKDNDPKYIYPVIVTNAELGLLSYTEKEMAHNGDLKKWEEIEPVKYLAYNIPYIMYFIKNGEPVHLYYQKVGRGDPTKTVFIVNVEHLKSFVEYLYDDINIGLAGVRF